MTPEQAIVVELFRLVEKLGLKPLLILFVSGPLTAPPSRFRVTGL